MPRKLMELVLRYEGHEVERVRSDTDAERGDQLHRHLVASLHRCNISERDIAKCALDVHQPGFRDSEFTFTALDADRT